MADPRGCAICLTLSPSELLELDALMGDPANWPSTIWGMFEAPKGGLPASYRRWGAQRVGEEWLTAHGYGRIPTTTIRRHLRYDVHHVARDVAELVQVGLIRSTKANTRIPVSQQIDAGAFIRYFNSGIQMGEVALRMLAERINQTLDEGNVPDAKLVMKLADMGASFAKVQATLMARGLKFGEDPEEDDAFRAKPGDDSTKIGHTRVKTIDGERVALPDQGLADRERHAARARMDGVRE